jgi:hypothetical protein
LAPPGADYRQRASNLPLTDPTYAPKDDQNEGSLLPEELPIPLKILPGGIFPRYNNEHSFLIK